MAIPDEGRSALLYILKNTVVHLSSNKLPSVLGLKALQEEWYMACTKSSIINPHRLSFGRHGAWRVAEHAVIPENNAH